MTSHMALSSVLRRCSPALGRLRGHRSRGAVRHAPVFSPWAAAVRGQSDVPRQGAPSAVNVETFTLNEEVVRRDMEALDRWNALSRAMDEARGRQSHTEVLQVATQGLAMLEELGAESAPLQCEALLCMEAAQACYNTGDYEEAKAMATRARQSLMTGRKELWDMAHIMELNQFLGHVLCRQGKAREAWECLSAVRQWIDVDAKSAMPMQAVAALHLRRAVLLGMGQSLTAMADRGETVDADEGKALYSRALDLLIESLNLSLDERDIPLVKDALRSILTCFEGLGDAEQALTTCRKYIRWCRRHEDPEGVAQGQGLMTALAARHGLELPAETEPPAE